MSTTAKLISLCAIGLLISFFLPWAQIAGQNISGFDIQKMDGKQMWLWIIPVLSVFSIFAVLTGRYQKSITGFAGAIPFCVLAYWLKQLGGLLFHILGFGAWLSLVFGLALLALPHGLQRKAPRL